MLYGAFVYKIVVNAKLLLLVKQLITDHNGICS